jgi:SAM-dependent methyltransferase
MQTAAPDITQLKSRMKETWMAGDFGQIANFTAPEAENFVARIGIRPGAKVLDVACGTGNTAIPAAKAGASVTGVDIARNSLEQAKKWAESEQLNVRFEEGDAEELPYADHSFDVVVTMFGAMFAPRPEKVAAELLRVCKPGGIIAMANWTPHGFVGKSFEVTSKMVPPPPVPPPVLWGDETVVRQRLRHEAHRLHSAECAFPVSLHAQRDSFVLPQIFRPDANVICPVGRGRPVCLGGAVGISLGRTQHVQGRKHFGTCRISRGTSHSRLIEDRGNFVLAGGPGGSTTQATHERARRRH